MVVKVDRDDNRCISLEEFCVIRTAFGPPLGAKLRKVFEILAETDELFQSCVEDGLLPANMIEEFREHLEQCVLTFFVCTRV